VGFPHPPSFVAHISHIDKCVPPHVTHTPNVILIAPFPNMWNLKVSNPVLLHQQRRRKPVQFENVPFAKVGATANPHGPGIANVQLNCGQIPFRNFQILFRHTLHLQFACL
jgi:hypothetical protein